MKFAQRLFLVAGIYGLAVLVPQYFLEAKNGRDFPPPITHPEYYYGFIGVAVAWQVMFLLIARNPARYRAAMLPAILEKLGFGVAVVALFLLGRVSSLVLFGFAIVDLIFAALFIAAYATTKRQETHPS